MSRGIGWACLVGLAVLISAQPVVAPYDPTRTDPSGSFRPPDAAHPLGTDGVGRDVLARLAAGAWRSLLVGVVALVLSSGIGVAAGLLAGGGGTVADRLITGLIDVLLGFPRFVLLLSLAAILPVRSVVAVGLLIGASSWMRTARLVRTEVLSLRERAFVEAARAAGAGRARVLAGHLGPHIARLVLESAGLRFSSVVLTAASLDFLGVGLPADSPTWGRLILDGRGALDTAPWIALSAVGALCLLSVGLVLVGERHPTAAPNS